MKRFFNGKGNMPKYLSTVALSFFALTGWSAPIEQAQARQIAADFLAQRNGAVISEAATVREEGADACYYVFNTEGNKGWVIVAGDDAMPKEILAFNLSGRFNAGQQPNELAYWTRGFQQIPDKSNSTTGIKKVRANKAVSSSRPTSIAPMIDAEWGQGYYAYNKYCPEYDGVRGYVGCVAVSMAMVMYQHQYPKALPYAIPAYSKAGSGTWNSYTITYPEVPAGTVIDWDNILPSYIDMKSTGYKSYSASQNADCTTEQEDAIGYLMRYAGNTVNMSYAPTASGSNASNISAGMAYFGYPSGALTYPLSSSSQTGTSGLTEDQRENIYYWELSQGRSFICGGANSGNGTVDAAHSYVCDGYDATTGLFHINWGWYGDSNGYYDIQTLGPFTRNSNGSTYKYDKQQTIVLGLAPNKYGMSGLEVTDISLSGTTVKVTFKNATGSNLFGFNYALGSINEETGLIKNYAPFTSNVKASAAVDETFTYTVDLATVFSNTNNALAEGTTYKFVPVSRLRVITSGTKYAYLTGWAAALPYDDYYIEAVKNGSTINARLVTSTGIHVTDVHSGNHIADDAVYNLQGQRVTTPARKGIYIKNGKKVIIGNK